MAHLESNNQGRIVNQGSCSVLLFKLCEGPNLFLKPFRYFGDSLSENCFPKMFSNLPH